jgi:hypothetical protein
MVEPGCGYSLEQTVDQRLHERVCNADGVQDQRQVVANDANTVPLSEGSETDHNEEPLSVSGRSAPQPVPCASLSSSMVCTISLISRTTSGLLRSPAA